MQIVSSTEKNPILQTSKIVSEEVPHIVFAVETYDKVKLQSILDKLNDYFHNTNEKPDVVKKNVIYCIMEVRNKLILKYPERDFLENVSDDFLTDILSKKTFEDVSNYLKQILFTFLENFNFNTTESVIVKLIAYLKNNYSEDLKLETLGDMFNCNSNLTVEDRIEFKKLLFTSESEDFYKKSYTLMMAYNPYELDNYMKKINFMGEIEDEKNSN